jgi:hypothetical protein
MGWLFMSLAGMGRFSTLKSYLDDQRTYLPDLEKGGSKACGFSNPCGRAANIMPPSSLMVSRVQKLPLPSSAWFAGRPRPEW